MRGNIVLDIYVCVSRFMAIAQIFTLISVVSELRSHQEREKKYLDNRKDRS